MTKKIILKTEISVYSQRAELSEEDRSLLEIAALKATDAYAPYSNFNVGAAVLLDNGTIVSGNNQENAAYPNGLCAERVALFYASANYPKCGIKAIAITARYSKQTVKIPVSPCGACRQVLAEYESRTQKPIKVIMAGETGHVFVCNEAAALLPLSFSKEYLL